MKTDGGPAFPATTPPGEDLYGKDVTSGMSVRDYFAAQVMQGIVTADFRQTWQYTESRAEFAYQVADAMLVARVKGTKK